MVKPNICLVIVDALRYDAALKMPFLRQLGQELPGGYWFENHWSTSHCTDPGLMHMLTGKHPDELRLYSMMFDDKNYVAPEVPTFFRTANDNGYRTVFITNVQRWYSRDVQTFLDSRGRGIEWPWSTALQEVKHEDEPWLMVLHTDDCHTRYTGGSYSAACGFTDRKLKELYDACPRNTVFMVTADHGEGLGEAGPDGVRIEQHGYGLWDFLTHIPFVVHVPRTSEKLLWTGLSDHGSLFEIVFDFCTRDSFHRYDPGKYFKNLVFQAGATPRVFHRGVVDPFGRQFIRANYKDGRVETYCLPEGDVTRELELDLREHCEQCEIEYGDLSDEAALIERLKGLGYWDDNVPSH